MSVEQTSMNQLITDNIDIWTSTVKTKPASGRGSSIKRELYGVKKLRELILELAVRGKLVPQDPSDEPASILLERIAAEKVKLVKQKQIKKPKALPVIEDDEKPFDLPQGWEWARLGVIGNIFNGNSVSARVKEQKYSGGVGLPFIATKDVGYGFQELDYQNGVHIPVGEPKFKIARKNAVLLCAEGGSAGKKCGITTEDICFGNKLFANELYGGVSPKFILSNYLAPYFYAQFSESMTGIIGGISALKFNELLVPMPPLQEQNRIVAKVDELMALCDQLEQQTEASIEAHQVLVTTLLDTLTNSTNAEELMQNWLMVAEHFDTLFTTEESIDQLKQTILQLAVMGKLVPQDPTDEPAAKLLERIAEEKAQLIKDKVYQKTSKLKPKNELISYPRGWVKVQIGQVCPSIVPNRDRPKSFTGAIPWVTLPAFPQQSLYLDSTEVELALTETEIQEYSARLIPAGSVLMSCVGRFGLTAINTVPVTSNQQVHAFITLKGLLPEYLSMVIRVEGKILESVATSTTIAYLNKTNCESIQFGLPPENEQHLIVEKAKELIDLCEQLKVRLSSSQITQLHITDSFVGMAL